MTLYWYCNKCKEWFRTIIKYHEDTNECFLCTVAEFEGWNRSEMGNNHITQIRLRHKRRAK